MSIFKTAYDFIRKPVEAVATVVVTVFINKIIKSISFWSREKKQNKKEAQALKNYKESTEKSAEQQEKAFEDLNDALNRGNN